MKQIIPINKLTRTLIETVEWYAKHLGQAPKKLNNGSCDEFASKVLDKMKDLNLHLINLDLTVSSKGASYSSIDDKPIDIDALMEFVKESKNDTRLIKLVSVPHSWIFDGELHYDAEATSGVRSMFDLPLFIRANEHTLIELKKMTRMGKLI